MPNIEIYYDIKVFDRNGKLVDAKFIRGHSYVKNFLAILRCLLRGEPEEAVDTAGNTTTVTYPNDDVHVPFGVPIGWRINAPAGDVLAERGEPTDWGVLVGKGTTPFSITDYSLADPYPHGHGAGYMNYLDTEVSDVEVYGDYVQIRVRRIIVNEADIDQDVTEVGIVAREYYTWKKFLICRDVLSSPITVPAKGILDLTVILRAKVSPMYLIGVKDIGVGGERATVTIA